MRIETKSKKIGDVLADSRAMKKKLNIEWCKKIQVYLNSLVASENFNVFLQTGMDHPEALKGYEEPIWSLRITANVRLIFKLSDKEPSSCDSVEIQGVCDYHGNKSIWYLS